MGNAREKCNGMASWPKQLHRIIGTRIKANEAEMYILCMTQNSLQIYFHIPKIECSYGSFIICKVFVECMNQMTQLSEIISKKEKKYEDWVKNNKLFKILFT